MYDLHCPICHLEFEAEAWKDGECPSCGNGYRWEVYYTLEDSFNEVCWDNYE